jgi:basic amino acid/polyamine antiporter, APA family
MAANDRGNLLEPQLLRALSLPLLIFYGLGVTVGAGIFALIGEIVGIAGDAAPTAFLVAGLIAGATGLSYALLVRVYPQAGGEAVFVTRGLGPLLGRFAGLGVAVTGIVSSAAIALAFAGYAGVLVDLPQHLLAVVIVVLLALLACWGVRESVAFAAIVTVLEVGTLAIVIIFGLPFLGDLPEAHELVGIDHGLSGLFPVLSAATLAFFAFIGFEDIVNMVEETRDPVWTAPRATLWTLAITVLVYFALALVAISAPGREAMTSSPAPLAVLFENVSNMDSSVVSVIAAIAMVNGILVQILMSARVLYGMANEGLLPKWFGRINSARRTPIRATIFVSLIIVALAITLPLVQLAELTSIVILAVFALVNLSLFMIGRRHGDISLRRWRYWGLFSFGLCAAILGIHLVLAAA